METKAMTSPVLAIDNLTVSLPSGSDRQNAVTNLSLTVNPGEIVCVVGESGSGKSVTAQAVMGLLPKRQLTVTGGRILLQDEDTVTATPDRLRALRGAEFGGGDEAATCCFRHGSKCRCCAECV